MDDRVVLYASPEHLNSMLVLAKFTARHHPSISITIICTAPNPVATSVSPVPSITYYRLPATTLPPNLTDNPVELFFEIPRLDNPNLREALLEISKRSRIRAFVLDFFCNSAVEVSTSLNLPTYFYVSFGGFGACTFLHFPTIDVTIPQDIGNFNDFLEVPGCPPIHSLDFPKGMLFRETNTYRHFINTAFNMGKSSGIIVNTFDALEFRAKEALSMDLCMPDSKTKTPPVYFVGPLIDEKISENAAAEAEHECLSWLDSQPSKSVVFLCFGRRGVLSSEQLKEMAIGLENSGQRFLWAVRLLPHQEEIGLDPVLPEGFLERTKDRGFIVKTWAPQPEVLKHRSVGGFVTHCGWSSILEAVSFGVPMIGWPLYAEQKWNRVFMVEEMKVALPLDQLGADDFVTAAELEKRVRELMETDSGKAVRERVTEMKIAADAAVRKGGSSVADLEKFSEWVTRD